MTQAEIVFAKIKDQGYIAGTSLETLLQGAKDIYPEIPPSEIIQITFSQIPEEYYWSALAVRRSNNWQNTGTFLLIKNLEKSPLFHQYFPHINYDFSDTN